MLDLSSDKGRVVKAALDLAGERAWGDVSMRDIADRAGMTLAELRRLFGSKTQILTGYIRAVDDAVLANAPARDDLQAPRDLLFETIMARFDLMAEHRDALRSINADTTFDTTLAGSLLNSQRWMLLAAGIDGDGPLGVMRSVGLASLYGSVFRTWLEDDDPGQAKTMAVLDRRLRRAEQTVSGIDQACDAVSRVMSTFRSGLSRARERARPSRSGEADEAAAPASGAGGFDDEFGSAGNGRAST